MSKAKEENKHLSNGCEMYDPCPLCFKCMNKAAHLYRRCEKCPVMHDAHTHKHRAMLIRRENFAITVSDEVGEQLLQLSEAANESK